MMHLSPPEITPSKQEPLLHPGPGAAETFHDKFVILFDFGDIDDDANTEFNSLLEALEAAGLHTEIRPGYEQTLLVFVKASKQLLGNTVYKRRVTDWLYAITQVHPGGNKDTVVKGWYESEDLLSMYHLVHWPTELGGAGVTPEVGQWEHVKAIFPLHNLPVNRSLLRHLSRRLLLDTEDLDRIRDLFGSKVAFYFAFIQIYLVFLSFPAVTGICAWLWFPKYSLAYAMLTSVWCTVFLEYWKVQELDFCIRWNVRGVNKAKVNRPEFKYDSVRVDANGLTKYYFPKWKQITRQLLQIPFIVIATGALGAIIGSVFAIEVLISETYKGSYKFYLEYLPTVILAVAIPYISSSLEGVATWITDFENHRTADNHEMSLTQKIFALSIITNYLPILLTAFVYVPFGDDIVPWLDGMFDKFLPIVGHQFTSRSYHADTDRLRNEVIALTVTGQLSSFFEENIIPLIKHKFVGWWRDIRRAYGKSAMLMSMVKDDPAEAEFLSRCRNEATLANYNVQDDIAEIVLQFGYLALFSPVWPLIPLGFLVNNWIELRSDFAKICIEHRRPPPLRAEGIGPWTLSLEILTWIGSISTAAIVHLFGTDGIGDNSWATLPITIFISEHTLLILRGLTRYIFERVGSEQLRNERSERYARRLKYLEDIEANKQAGVGLTVAEKERRKSVLVSGSDAFWTKQVEDGASAAEGKKLMALAKHWEGTKTD